MRKYDSLVTDSHLSPVALLMLVRTESTFCVSNCFFYCCFLLFKDALIEFLGGILNHLANSQCLFFVFVLFGIYFHSDS